MPLENEQKSDFSPEELERKFIPVLPVEKREEYSFKSESAISRHRILMTGRSSNIDLMFDSTDIVVANGTVTTVTSATQTDLELIDLSGTSWNVGKVIRLTARGVYSNTDGTSVVTIRVGTGTAPTTEWNSMASTAAVATTQPWQLSWIGVVTALGTSGTLEAQMTGKINNVNKDDPNTVAVTFDTTSTRLLALTAQWSATDAGNTISIRQFLLEILN